MADEKKPGMMVISRLQAKATVVAVTDGKDIEMMVDGRGSETMPMIEEMVVHIFMDAYKKKLAEDGEGNDTEAVKFAAGLTARFTENIKKRMQKELLMDKLKRTKSCPEPLMEIVADAIMKANEDDDEQEEDDE